MGCTLSRFTLNVRSLSFTLLQALKILIAKALSVDNKRWRIFWKVSSAPLPTYVATFTNLKRGTHFWVVLCRGEGGTRTPKAILCTRRFSRPVHQPILPLLQGDWLFRECTVSQGVEMQSHQHVKCLVCTTRREELRHGFEPQSPDYKSGIITDYTNRA